MTRRTICARVAQRRRGFLGFEGQFHDDRFERAHDKGQTDEDQSDQDAERRIGNFDAERSQQRAEPTVGREQCGQRDAGNRGRQCERHVDQRIGQVTAGEAVADHDPGDQQAEGHIDGGGQRSGSEAQPQRCQDAWRGDRLPHAGNAEFPGTQGQRGQRHSTIRESQSSVMPSVGINPGSADCRIMFPP